MSPWMIAVLAVFAVANAICAVFGRGGACLRIFNGWVAVLCTGVAIHELIS